MEEVQKTLVIADADRHAVSLSGLNFKEYANRNNARWYFYWFVDCEASRFRLKEYSVVDRAAVLIFKLT